MDLHSLCDAFGKPTAFLGHRESAHDMSEFNAQFRASVSQSEEAVDLALPAACPLCDDWAEVTSGSKVEFGKTPSHKSHSVKQPGSLKQFRRHPGRSMEQLALFALPVADNEEFEDDNASEDEANLGSGDSVPATTPAHDRMCQVHFGTLLVTGVLRVPTSTSFPKMASTEKS